MKIQVQEGESGSIIGFTSPCASVPRNCSQEWSWDARMTR